MSRNKPYTTNQETWNTILQKKLTIPMNQREYSWEKEEIDKFLEDIFKIYEERINVLKMGSIINLNYKISYLSARNAALLVRKGARILALKFKIYLKFSAKIC